MPQFTVLRRVDAYADYVAIVEADDEEEAALLASDNEGDYEWQEDGVVTFDARHFVTLTAGGQAIERTLVGEL